MSPAKKRPNLILLSKLQPPQIKNGTLHRDRLINLLFKNLDKKIILLCAGAGYGKTTLLSQFLSVAKFSHVYYHLEKSDAVPVVFLSYLIAGIKKIKPEFGAKTEDLSHLLNDPQKYLEIVIGTFINEITEFITHDLFIILEDYHSLVPSEPINRMLEYLLKHLPRHLHFIITTRTMPSFSLSPMKARNEILELSSQQLKFTRDEIKYLFEKIYAIFLKGPELKLIEEHSEGWPTSLRLMLESSNYLEGIKSSDYIRKILDSYHQSQVNLFNYFAQEIYNQETEKVKKFLVDCSILEWLIPELFNAVTGRKDSASILADLTNRNAFIFRMPGPGYRLHHLFRDFLRSKFNDLNRAKRIYHHAANFYLQKNELEEAVKFYLLAEEYTRAAALIEKIGFKLIEQGKSAILCAHIEKLPNSIRSQRPLLLMHYAQSLIHLGRPDEARNNYLTAAQLLKKRASDRLKYADALYELGGIGLNQGNFSVAKKWLKKALGVCPKSPNITRAAILNSLGFIYTEVGGKNLSAATKYFAKAFQIARRKKYSELEASILNNWASNEWKAGNLSQAYTKLSKIANLLAKHFSPHCGAGFFNAARLSLLLGHLKDARAILDLGIKTCRAYNDLWSTATLGKGYSLVYQELGEIKKARQFITKSLEIYEKLGITRLIITALNELAKINITAGNLGDAEKNLADIWWFKKIKDDTEAIPIFLTEAKLRITQGKFNEAENILSKARYLTQRFKLIFNSFLINIELSKVFYHQGKIEKVLMSLKEAVAISRAKGYDYLLAQEFKKEEWLMPTIKTENIEKRYIMSVIKQAEFGIHRLDAFLFGVPRIYLDGSEIKDGDWKTLKAKKLFFYLLLHKNERINNDSLINALWQDVSYTSGRYSLRKAIQHIRQTFKSNVAGINNLIISSRDFYQISPQISVGLDTDEFQDITAQVNKLKKEDETLKPYLQKALAIYKNGFAVGWYDQWAEDLRHYYEGQYEKCLALMGDLYFGKNNFKEAIIWYKKLISLNFYEEEYHRKLMTGHAKLGKYKEAVQIFEKLSKVLKKELHAKPQQETMDLYKSLTK